MSRIRPRCWFKSETAFSPCVPNNIHKYLLLITEGAIMLCELICKSEYEAV